MKTFNFFEKLWEHGRTLRRVGLVLVMCLMTITQVWASTSAYNVASLASANSWTTGSSGTSGSSLNQTISDISFSFTNGSTYNTYLYNSNPKSIQFHSDGNTITVSTSSSYKITAVDFVVTTGSSSPRWNAVTNGSTTVSGSWLRNSSAFTPSSTNIDGATYTFSPTTAVAGESLVFSINRNSGSPAGGAYLRITSITVTYQSVGTRKFKSGEKIYFKDEWKKSGDGYSGNSNVWTTNSLAAYFWGDGDGWYVCNGSDNVYGDWNKDNTIYEITVPGSDKEFTHVMFLRGNMDPYDSDETKWTKEYNRTTEQTASEGYNIFYIQNKKDDYSHYYGSWGRFAKNAALVGEFNNWNPDTYPLSSTGVQGALVPLAANTTYEFKILLGEIYYGINSASTITSTLTSWWTLYSGQGNLPIRTDVAGDYGFAWNGSSKNMTVYYPDALYPKNQYLYFDVRNETYWNTAPFTARFYLKNFDTSTDLSDMPLECSSPLEDYVYYVKVPNNGYIGHIQMNRYYNSSVDGTSDVTHVYSRSSAMENCMKEESGKENYQNSWTPQWKTYCPPMSSSSLSDNSTELISWQTGNGTSGNPFLVSASGTIKVSASATKAVDDDNMTPMYDFKVNTGSGASSAQSGEGTTYDKGSLSNNTTYEISVDAWNNYNSTDGTKNTSATHIWYKAVTLRNVVHTLSHVTKSAGRVGDNQAADNEPYTATFTAATGYNLPATITVKFGDATKTAGSDYTWNSSTGVVSILANKINGNVTIIVTGVAKTTSITLDDNNENNGATGDGSASVDYDATALTTTSHTTPADGYQRTGYWTAKTGGYKVLNADGSFATYSSNISSYISSANKWCNESENITLYAQYEIKKYTVSFVVSPDGYGSVSPTSISNVEHGSEVDIDENVLTLMETSVTATAADATAAYTYAFDSWSVSDEDEITSAQTITATFTRTANQYSVSITPTNVTKLTGSTGSNAATYGTNYTATFRRNLGYSLPSTITVTIGDESATSGDDYTWNSSTGTLTVPGAKITGNIAVSLSGTAVSCPDGSSTETLFSLSSVGSGYSNTSGAETELTGITVSGGFAYGYGEEGKALSYSSNKIKYAGGVNYIKLTLDCALQPRDIISFSCDANTGLNFNSDKDGEAAGDGSYTTGALNGSTYTVVADDGLDGESTIYCWRRTSNGTNVTAITITRPGAYDITKSATNGTISTKVGGSEVTQAVADAKVAIKATPSTGYEFDSWDVYKTGESSTKVDLDDDDDSDGSTRQFDMPAYDVTVAASFTAIDYDITHSDASNGSYTIKVASGDATGSSTTANYGQTITLTATPSSGYVFDHWTTSGTSVTLSNANVSPATFTMPAGNVAVNAVFKLQPNIYYYKDATHFTAPSTWKNPEGNAPSNTTDETLALTDPWTISQSVAGVTSVVVNDGKWDNKSGTDYKWATAYIKIPSGGDKDNSNITFTIASGYEATIKMKIGSWTGTPGITLKKLSGGSLGDALSKTGSIGGHATTENAFNELTWSSLSEGIYVLTVTSKNCYISEIDIQTESLGYAITKSATNGTISTKVGGSEVTRAAEDATVTITATPSTGYHFTGWTVTETESGDPVSVAASRTTPTTFTMPAAAVTVDAGFELTNHRVTMSSAFKGEYTIQVDGGGATRFSTYATYGQTITLHTTRTSTNEYVWSTWGVTMTETGDPVAVTLSTDSTFAMPDGPVTIRPIYGKLYTVSFNTNGGSSAPGDIKQTTVGGTITMPSAPTKSGYTFAGWVIGSETYAAGSTSYVPTDNVTAIAAWKATCAGGGGSDTNITIFDGTISTNPAPNAEDGTSGLTYKKGKEYTDATTGFKHKLVEIKDALVDISEVSFTNKGSYVNAIKWGGASTSYYAKFVVPSGYTASITLTYVLTANATKYIGFGTSNSAQPNGSNFDTNVAITTNNAVGSYTFSSLSSGTYYLMCSGGDKFYVLGLSATVTSAGACNYVTYDGNGATGGITNDPRAYEDDETVTVLANGFSRPGYEFTGWNTEDEGTGTAYDPDDDDHNTFTISGNPTLYAQWNPLTLYFNGSGSGTDYDWFNKVNWTVSGGEPGCVPTIEHDVVLEKQTRLYGQEVSGEGNHAKAKSIKIDKSTDARKNIRMEIWSYCSMIVAQGITAKHIGDADFGATTYEDVRVETSILGNAGLVCGNASSNTEVTYIFRTKAFMVTVNEGGKNKKYYRNQYFGIPFTTIDGDQYWGSILYKYDGNSDAWAAPETDGEGKVTLAPFTAYNLIRRVEAGDEFMLKGTLNLPGTGAGKTRTLTCGWRAEDTGSTIDENKDYQDFMFANSWSAPIDISSMTASDCSGTDGADLVHTIYIFNTGYEVGGVKQVGDEDGQWSAFPFESSAYMEGAVIPATQAFLVTSTKGSTGATLTLDYKKHVYDPAVAAGQTNTYATRAPRRNRAEYDAPIRLKMVVKTDSLVLDKLYMFERPDFTNEFDNGWDGTKIEGVTTVPMIYAVQGNSKMAVSAVPELDGEEIVFRAGTKSNVYTFKFEYDEDAYPLYLYDRETGEFTCINSDATYTFTTDDNLEHARFVLTRSKTPQIATGFIDGVETSNKEIDTTVRKIIKNDHVYILRGGHVYSIDGSMIK